MEHLYLKQYYVTFKVILQWIAAVKNILRLCDFNNLNNPDLKYRVLHFLNIVNIFINMTNVCPDTHGLVIWFHVQLLIVAIF